jgi:hypothetical protein
LQERLEAAIESGAPNDKFLWPMELVSAPDMEGFGYVMPIRDSQYRGLVEMMAGRIEPSFRSLWLVLLIIRLFSLAIAAQAHQQHQQLSFSSF